MKKVCALLSALLVLLALPASAQVLKRTNLNKPSSNYDIGMMFYKLSGKRPDFVQWIQSESRYKTATPAQQQSLLGRVSDLQLTYEGLDPKRVPLVIRVPLRLTLEKVRGTGKDVLVIEFPSDGDVYFPYVVNGQPIAVIPNGIDVYRRIPVTPTEADNLRIHTDPGGMSTMVLELQAVSADAKTPMVLDNVPQWLMIGEINSLAFYNGRLETLWAFQSPTVAARESELMSLRPTKK